jgi:hypothetical protein
MRWKIDKSCQLIQIHDWEAVQLLSCTTALLLFDSGSMGATRDHLAFCAWIDG